MVKEGYVELKNATCTFIMIVTITLVGFTFYFYFELIECKESQPSISDSEIAIAQAEWRYKEETMRLVNQTGIPNQYSCKDLKFMISTNTIPPEVSTYNCKRNPEAEEQWCKTFTNPNNKQVFKDYFILNCLEVKS